MSTVPTLIFSALWLFGVACLILWARRGLRRARAVGYFDYGLGRIEREGRPGAFRVQVGFHYLYMGVGSSMFLAGLAGTAIGLMQR